MKNDSPRNIKNERRKFLKKTLYAAPTLIVLGQLVKPVSVYAEYVEPPDPPAASNSGSESSDPFDSGL